MIKRKTSLGNNETIPSSGFLIYIDFYEQIFCSSDDWLRIVAVILKYSFLLWRYLSEKPHLAGSERNNELGDYIAERWKSYGMKVYKKSYEVLLSVPQSPAVLQLLHVNGSVDFEPIMTEHAYFKEENDTAPPFSAYSQTGSVQVCCFLTTTKKF